MQNSISRFSSDQNSKFVLANNKQTQHNVKCPQLNWFIQLIYSMFSLNYTWKSASLQREMKKQRNSDGAIAFESKIHKMLDLMAE